MHGHKQARGGHLEEVNGETMTTLLLVEDEALIRHGLRMWLDQVSYQILWITDVLSRKEATNESRCVSG
jgi:DNA-binding NtrC family response regulator